MTKLYIYILFLTIIVANNATTLSAYDYHKLEKDDLVKQLLQRDKQILKLCQQNAQLQNNQQTSIGNVWLMGKGAFYGCSVIGVAWLLRKLVSRKRLF